MRDEEKYQVQDENMEMTRARVGGKCHKFVPIFPSSMATTKRQTFTYEEDDVDDDENIFDEVDAAAVRVAILWFLYFDLFLRLRLWLLARRAAAAAAVVVVDVVVVMTGCAILG